MASLTDPRRQNSRIYFSGKEVHIETVHGHTCDCQLMDLSIRGIGVIASSGFFEGDKVDMQFEIFNHHFHIAGDVKRVDGKETFIRFAALTQDEKDMIEMLIEEHGTFKKTKKNY